MKYELIKKLYDAGFPVIEHDSDGINPDYPTYITLSELIEACGDRFSDLLNRPLSKNRYMAIGIGATTDYFETPEEAVGNLWLDLNKK